MQQYDRYATLCMNVCLFSHGFDQVHPNLGSCFGLCMSRCLLEPLHVFAVWQNLVVTALLHDFATDFLSLRVPYDLRSLGSVSFISMIQRSPCLSLKRVEKQDTAGDSGENGLDEQRRGGRERLLTNYSYSQCTKPNMVARGQQYAYTPKTLNINKQSKHLGLSAMPHGWVFHVSRIFSKHVWIARNPAEKPLVPCQCNFCSLLHDPCTKCLTTPLSVSFR